MTLNLYMDQNIRTEITQGLPLRGVDVLTTFEDGHSETEDSELLEHVTSLGRILFSQDEDFLAITAAWQQQGKQFSGLVYAHMLAITIGQAVGDLELICRACTAGEMENRVIYLPL